MKAVRLFVAISYALSIVLSLVIGLTGSHESRLIGLSFLSMLLPTCAFLIVFSITKEPINIRWDRIPVRYLPIALFLIPGVMHAVMLPLRNATNGGLQWQDWLTPQADGLYHSDRGWGVLTIQGLVGHILVNAIVGLLVVSLLALFEEVGWRAWLLPRLVDRIGTLKAVLLTSIIWALWHVPFQLSGIQHIDGVSPIRLALTIPIGTFSTGLILGWLWLRTESIWLVSIAHASMNNWGQYAFKYMKDSDSPDRDLMVLSIGSLALSVVGMFLLLRNRVAAR